MSRIAGIAVAELKTQANDASVPAFLARVPDPARRADCERLVALMREISGAEPRLWGSSIIGFGVHRLRYESGRELDWPPIAFSPRKQDLTLYLSGGLQGREAMLAKLGKHKTGKGCLYLRRLADVDLSVLGRLIGDALPKAPGAKPRAGGTAKRARAAKARP